ncbi:MAG: methionyl-tRNA formyltransferase [Bacteroidetes bacterium]|nr:methionyl-tRNA formyltransferase [Bacteroidota bacterium]
MKILFAGTPEIAVPSLRKIAGEFTVCGVLTNPDRIRTRGKKILPSPVKAAAQEFDIPLVQPERLFNKAREAVAALSPDLLVTFAYGRIFGPKFLSLFPMGGINIHPSLLPKLRGSSPIQSALLGGLRKTGITIQEIALEMDSGNILMQKEITLFGTETTESLTESVSAQSAEMLCTVLHELQKGTTNPIVQDEAEATYCGKIEKNDRKIDWTKDAETLSSEVRAFIPWPKSATTFKTKNLMITYALPVSEHQLRVDSDPSKRPVPGTVLHDTSKDGLIVVCGLGGLLVTKLQLETKKVMDWKAFLHGNADILGSVLI